MIGDEILERYYERKVTGRHLVVLLLLAVILVGITTLYTNHYVQVAANDMSRFSWALHSWIYANVITLVGLIVCAHSILAIEFLETYQEGGIRHSLAVGLTLLFAIGGYLLVTIVSGHNALLWATICSAILVWSMYRPSSKK